MSRTHILNLSCDDQPGIVAAVATALLRVGANIAESAQFLDQRSNRFLMRISFTAPGEVAAEEIERALGEPAERFGMAFSLLDADRTPAIVVMASRSDHALLHLIYQIRVGWLKARIVGIVSNHEDGRRIADAEGIPYHVWPATRDNRAEREARLLELVAGTSAELIVLARYMQVLSDSLATQMIGRIINIHHSFLPSFKGAGPYHQAFARGVKLIGATAHYVTADLDEGPIIEQETQRVTHAMGPADFIAIGRDIESRVLARAVKLHLEARVIINGNTTVVF